MAFAVLATRIRANAKKYLDMEEPSAKRIILWISCFIRHRVPIFRIPADGAHVHLAAFSARLNSLVKKSNVEAGIAEPSLGLKARSHFIGVVTRLKSFPFTHRSRDVVFHQAVKSLWNRLSMTDIRLPKRF
jgi:hypothetical protein